MKIFNILTPYWFKIIWDDTASKMHLTQVTYVTCTSDWQQNLTYAHKSQHFTYIMLQTQLLIKRQKGLN